MSEVTAPELTIVCRYSCQTCGIRQRAVEVPARSGEDILTWVRQTADLLAADHLRVVPGCRGQTCDLYVPWPTAPGQHLGEATRQ